jgi:ribosomal protein L21E
MSLINNFAITTHEPKIPESRPQYKKGQHVKIIRYDDPNKSDNPYNLYKGYTGLIIKYNYNDDYILVNIEALYKHINIHVNQIELYNYELK